MRRLVFALLLILPACIPADAKPICGKPGKPPCPTTTTPTPPPTTTTPTPAPLSTDKRIAVMLINFSDDVRQPWTTAFIDSRFDGPSRTVSDFYARSSFGQLDVSADVFGWFVIAQPATPCSLSATANQADAAATASGVDLSLYTNRMYVFPASGRTGECISNGDMPGTRSWVSIPVSSCVEATGICQERTFVHEFGHNLGMDHAGKLLCDGGVLDGTCTFGQYGDSYDVMGCCPGSLLSNVHRLQMGWIPPGQVITVTTSQILTVTPLNDPASLVYRIPYGANYLYLENRNERTIYENGPGTWGGDQLLFRIYPDFTVRAQSQVLDGSPATDHNTWLGLPVGESFTPPGGPTITNLAFDGANNTVQIGV